MGTVKALLLRKIPTTQSQSPKENVLRHIHKRVGNRVKELIKEVTGLEGAGMLTDSTADRLQNRSNAGDLPKMKKVIGAVIFHCASSKENE